MSGGSYDYAYSEMSSGEIEKFSQYAGRFIEHLQELAARLDAGGVDTWRDMPDGTPTPVKDGCRRRDMTDGERAVGLMGVGCALVAFQQAEKELKSLQARMRNLADIAHAIEWRESCDTGDDSTVLDCVKWMRKALEAP